VFDSPRQARTADPRGEVMQEADSRVGDFGRQAAGEEGGEDEAGLGTLGAAGGRATHRCLARACRTHAFKLFFCSTLHGREAWRS